MRAFSVPTFCAFRPFVLRFCSRVAHPTRPNGLGTVLQLLCIVPFYYYCGSTRAPSWAPPHRSGDGTRCCCCATWLAAALLALCVLLPIAVWRDGPVLPLCLALLASLLYALLQHMLQGAVVTAGTAGRLRLERRKARRVLQPLLHSAACLLCFVPLGCLLPLAVSIDFGDGWGVSDVYRVVTAVLMFVLMVVVASGAIALNVRMEHAAREFHALSAVHALRKRLRSELCVDVSPALARELYEELSFLNARPVRPWPMVRHQGGRSPAGFHTTPRHAGHFVRFPPRRTAESALHAASARRPCSATGCSNSGV